MVLHFLLVYNKLLEFCSLLQYLWSLIWIFIFYARTLKIVIFSYYTKHRSKVRCALLDVSKAFDMVDHGHLFDLLLQYNYQVLHFLFSAVLSMGTLSTSFRVTNGVRQGGVLSPILFTVYIDELMQQLLIQLILKTKPNNLFGVPTASS